MTEENSETEEVVEQVETLREEAIVKINELIEEQICGFCGIASERCPGGCCAYCDCLQ